jgi:hypothetical protein
MLKVHSKRERLCLVTLYFNLILVRAPVNGEKWTGEWKCYGTDLLYRLKNPSTKKNSVTHTLLKSSGVVFRFGGQQFHTEQYTLEKYYTSVYTEIKVLGKFLNRTS